ncbi:MAG TPA: response regulator transcription factor [Nitrospiria bacterium]|nr:response regulator transcription factor [Nitrospiria bacterium]
MTPAKTSVFIVDDHPLVREWLANLIHQQPEFLVCGEAEKASSALQAMISLKPDVAIVDISLKEGSGLELIKEIKANLPAVAVIVLSMHDETLYAERAIRAGARGYIMKRETTKRIIEAIRAVLGGKLYVSERLTALFAKKFLDGHLPTDGSPIEQLSDRELEVFQLLGQGYETRQVAESLHISMKTVQAYCARIKEKLGLASALELLREAIRWHEEQQAK